MVGNAGERLESIGLPCEVSCCDGDTFAQEVNDHQLRSDIFAVIFLCAFCTGARGKQSSVDFPDLVQIVAILMANGNRLGQCPSTAIIAHQTAQGIFNWLPPVCTQERGFDRKYLSPGGRGGGGASGLKSLEMKIFKYPKAGRFVCLLSTQPMPFFPSMCRAGMPTA